MTLHARPAPAPPDAPDETPIARRINGERLVLLGWGRAILLQLAHPLVAAGVADHSTFQRGRIASLRRLHDTVQASLALTFGTREESLRSAAAINRIHDRVHGRLAEAVGPYPAGTPYSAHDPALLTWVELTLLDSLPLAYERFVGPLTAAEKDAWCREARGSVARLGVPPDRVPPTYAGVREALDARLASGEIVVGDTARRLSRTVLAPPFGWLAWPWARLNRLATIGLLPPAIRDGYGLTWTPADARALDRAARLCRRVVPWTPAPVRHWRAARRHPSRR